MLERFEAVRKCQDTRNNVSIYNQVSMRMIHIRVWHRQLIQGHGSAKTQKCTMYPCGMCCIGIRDICCCCCCCCCCIGATMGLGGAPAVTVNAEHRKKTQFVDDKFPHNSSGCANSENRIEPLLEPEPLKRLPPCALLCTRETRKVRQHALESGTREHAGKGKHECDRDMAGALITGYTRGRR